MYDWKCESPDQIIQKAAETFRERGAQYGHSWEQVGEITKILYPNGIKLETVSNFEKFHILQWLIGKIVRYANSGSIDSIHDAGVYSFILEYITKNFLTIINKF